MKALTLLMLRRKESLHKTNDDGIRAKDISEMFSVATKILTKYNDIFTAKESIENLCVEANQFNLHMLESYTYLFSQDPFTPDFLRWNTQWINTIRQGFQQLREILIAHKISVEFLGDIHFLVYLQIIKLMEQYEDDAVRITQELDLTAKPADMAAQFRQIVHLEDQKDFNLRVYRKFKPIMNPQRLFNTILSALPPQLEILFKGFKSKDMKTYLSFLDDHPEHPEYQIYDINDNGYWRLKDWASRYLELFKGLYLFHFKPLGFMEPIYVHIDANLVVANQRDYLSGLSFINLLEHNGAMVLRNCAKSSVIGFTSAITLPLLIDISKKNAMKAGGNLDDNTIEDFVRAFVHKKLRCEILDVTSWDIETRAEELGIIIQPENEIDLDNLDVFNYEFEDWLHYSSFKRELQDFHYIPDQSFIITNNIADFADLPKLDGKITAIKPIHFLNLLMGRKIHAELGFSQSFNRIKTGTIDIPLLSDFQTLTYNQNEALYRDLSIVFMAVRTISDEVLRRDWFINQVGRIPASIDVIANAQNLGNPVINLYFKQNIQTDEGDLEEIGEHIAKIIIDGFRASRTQDFSGPMEAQLNRRRAREIFENMTVNCMEKVDNE